MQSEKVRLTRGLLIEGKRHSAHQVVEVTPRHAAWLRGIGAAVVHEEAAPSVKAPAAPADEAPAVAAAEAEGKED